MLQKSRVEGMSKLTELLTELCPNGVLHTSLETVCDFVSGFAFKSSTFSDSGTPVCKTTNIQNNEICFDGIDCISKADYKEHNIDIYYQLWIRAEQIYLLADSKNKCDLYCLFRP